MNFVITYRYNAPNLGRRSTEILHVSKFLFRVFLLLTTKIYPLNKKMVAQAPSKKGPLPDMMTSIRIDKSGQVEIVDQLLLP